jgi:methylated-DNA-[protein]-cysteine S-methyltransferase
MRVYEFARTIPRGETRTYGEVAARLRATGAVHSVAQAISKNPFMIIVPCHRVLEAGSYADKISPNGGAISKRRLLSIEGAHGTMSSKTLFDVLLPVAPPRLQG